MKRAPTSLSDPAPEIQILRYERRNVPIFTATPHPIRFDRTNDGPQIERLDLEFLPGAFELRGLLTPAECEAFVELTEQMGYGDEAAVSVGQDMRQNQTVTWKSDASVWGPIFNRARPFLPAGLDGEHLTGLNSRLRFYKYSDGAVFRPHYDGSWPGDHGERSKFTFLIYLNDGFIGGETTFFLPNPRFDRSGKVRAFPVCPSRGTGLCFVHGDGPLSPLHEGSIIKRLGPKYILRTDVLYTKTNALHDFPILM